MQTSQHSTRRAAGYSRFLRTIRKEIEGKIPSTVSLADMASILCSGKTKPPVQINRWLMVVAAVVRSHYGNYTMPLSTALCFFIRRMIAPEYLETALFFFQSMSIERGH
jgi:hypothetical protein